MSNYYAFHFQVNENSRNFSLSCTFFFSILLLLFLFFIFHASFYSSFIIGITLMLYCVRKLFFIPSFTHSLFTSISFLASKFCPRSSLSFPLSILLQFPFFPFFTLLPFLFFLFSQERDLLLSFPPSHSFLHCHPAFMSRARLTQLLSPRKIMAKKTPKIFSFIIPSQKQKGLKGLKGRGEKTFNTIIKVCIIYVQTPPPPPPPQQQQQPLQQRTILTTTSLKSL